MPNQDSIPRPDSKFDTLQGIIVAAIIAKGAVWGIPTAEITKVTDKHNVWAAAWQIAKDKQNSTTAQKKAKDLARAELLKVLRPFIQRWIYRNDLMDAAAIEQCGLKPRDTTPTPVNKPDMPVATIKRGETGELIATCAIVPKAKHYGCLMLEGGQLPPWLHISSDGKLILSDVSKIASDESLAKVSGFQMDLTEKSTKHFTGLKPGVTYYFYFYAVNNAGVSPLSEVVSMRFW